jgi:hypothetical protein
VGGRSVGIDVGTGSMLGNEVSWIGTAVMRGSISAVCSDARTLATRELGSPRVGVGVVVLLRGFVLFPSGKVPLPNRGKVGSDDGSTVLVTGSMVVPSIVIPGIVIPGTESPGTAAPVSLTAGIVIPGRVTPGIVTVPMVTPGIVVGAIVCMGAVLVIVRVAPVTVTGCTVVPSMVMSLIEYPGITVPGSLRPGIV